MKQGGRLYLGGKIPGMRGFGLYLTWMPYNQDSVR